MVSRYDFPNHQSTFVVSISTSFSSYYHGKLSRRDAEDALRDGANNSWLIRYSENEGKEIVSMKRYQVQEAPGVSETRGGHFW